MKQDNREYTDKKLSYHLNDLNLISPLDSEIPLFEPKIKLGILASGNGSNFEYIIKSIQNKQLNAEISILIVNNPNCLAIKKAIKYKIPYVIINHRDCDSRVEHDMLVMKKLEELSVELVVMAGWMRIVGKEIINMYKNRLINIHPSILPSFKGIDAIQQAIDHRVTITGCTVHYVQKEVDSGSIIIQAAVPIKKQDTKDSLKKRIQKMEHIILPLAIATVAKDIRTNFKDKK
ncbi:phosphoribosylglycinamide formyltransferase [Prochlorococcus marinus]|uniref:Phosphoribosylglycinamide formyltransferase n=1 Tax=Prochlorococcus marinus XMU1408 TaxID=2213228 RepID=A0A318RI88_PROMR|nr:phosphoribosylglycinamide formyltransferase [Prochlorococcus marinus]MBW3041948.1 phosphoribosylglycinamide formyltransferase [Prochlorococcus marinus str. XMU1408]PYE03293.1 phosphoribosylglycinamide formyltransferase [Prochlorococcus marinus XMU1408]